MFSSLHPVDDAALVDAHDEVVVIAHEAKAKIGQPYLGSHAIEEGDEERSDDRQGRSARLLLPSR